jgi:hypothetical protein
MCDSIDIAVGAFSDHLVNLVLIDHAAILDLDKVFESDVFCRVGERASPDGLTIESGLQAFAHLAGVAHESRIQGIIIKS